jgi:hypothetical protein
MLEDCICFARQDGAQTQNISPKNLAPNGCLPARFGRAWASPNRAEAERANASEARPEPNKDPKGEPRAGVLGAGLAPHSKIFFLRAERPEGEARRTTPSLLSSE